MRKAVCMLCLVLGGGLPLAATATPPGSVLNVPVLTPAQQAQLKGGHMPDGLTDDQEQALLSWYNLPYPTHRQIRTAEQAMQLDQAAASALHAGRAAEAEGDARQELAISQGVGGVGEELLASALEAQGKDQKALQEYQKMVLAYDDHPRNLLPYALLLLKAGRWPQAVAAYGAALPHLAFGDLVRASSHFRPDVPDPAGLETAIHIARGLTYNAEDDWARKPQNDLALTEYGKALALAPNSALTHLYHGYGLKKLGRTAEAKAAFAKAVELGDDDVKAEAAKFSR